MKAVVTNQLEIEADHNTDGTLRFHGRCGIGRSHAGVFG